MKRTTSARFILVLILVGIILLTGTIWFFSRPIDSSYLGEPKIFVVPRGDGSGEIGSRLEKEGLIRHRYAFWLAVEFYGLNGKLQAGSFRLSPRMSLQEIGLALTKGRLDQWVTIIEGARREEIAWQLKEEMGIESQDFMTASQGQEGFLFPDTYLLPQGTTAKRVVTIMTDNFEKKTKELWERVEKRGLTKEQVLVLASLVEREVKADEDRKLVAGILVKRWREDWPLQVDATVQYAKVSQDCLADQECVWWPAVKKVNLQINSPYNTYLNKGLPPGPICNSSLSSLKAVVGYQTSDYWFYLSDSRGEMHFAKSLEEHQGNVKIYLRK